MPDDRLDDQRQVRPAHLVGEERHAEDREDPPDGRVAEDAPQRAEREREDAARRDDRRAGPRVEPKPDERRRSRSTARPTPRRSRAATSRARSMRTPPRTGPTANPIGPDAPKTAMTVPIRRRGTTSRIAAEHDAGVAELEADQQQAHRQLPRLARQGDAGEHDRLDEAAPDDDGLAAVLVGPDAPQRDERHADDEDQRREQPDERQPIRPRGRPSSRR